MFTGKNNYKSRLFDIYEDNYFIFLPQPEPYAQFHIRLNQGLPISYNVLYTSHVQYLQ